MKQALIERVVERLLLTMTSAINKFSAQSGISSTILNNAMKEYLGSERDLLD
jgi:hypothetical protein